MAFKDRLTPVEVAEKLGVSRHYVYTLIKRGDLPAYKFRGRVFIDLKEFKQFVRQNIKPLNDSSVCDDIEI